MQEYRIGRLKGRFVVNVFDDSGARTNRYRLNAGDKSTAEREARAIVAALTKPPGKTADVNVTRKKYARYSPTYLREAAAALEYDDLGSTNLRCTTFLEKNAPKVPDYMVAHAVDIELVSTPKFPFIRENNREFRKSDGSSAAYWRKISHIPKGFGRNSL
jgi:hypothetical protein